MPVRGAPPAPLLAPEMDTPTRDVCPQRGFKGLGPATAGPWLLPLPDLFPSGAFSPGALPLAVTEREASSTLGWRLTGSLIWTPSQSPLGWFTCDTPLLQKES